MRMLRWVVLTASVTVIQSLSAAGCENRLLDTDQLRSMIAAIDGYDITATTNQGRFVSDVLLELAASLHAHDSEGRPFEIGPRDFFKTVASVAGIEPEQMPISFRRALEVGQVFTVDYRHARLVEGGAAAGDVEQARPRQ